MNKNFRMTRYFSIKPDFINEKQKNTHIKSELYYSLGGRNNPQNQDEPRGYYIYVTPVLIEHKREYRTETAELYAGKKFLILPVDKKSKKSEMEAQKLFDDLIGRILSNHFADYEIMEGQLC